MTARERLWLFMVDARAALLLSTGCMLPVLVGLGLNIAFTSRQELALVVSLGFVVSALTALWVFRTLRLQYTRNEAKAVAKAIVVLGPVALAISFPLAVFPGGLAEELLGSPFALVGALLGIVVMVTLMSFAFSIAALKMSRWP